MILYRIYTENKNREQIEKIVSELFDGFTVIESTGYWRGQREISLIIEILDTGLVNVAERIEFIAEKIKKINDQESVLVTKHEIEELFV